MKWMTISVAAFSLVAATGLGQETRKVRVDLAPDTNSKTLEGRIEGEESIDYIVPAEAGQRLKVVYRSENMGTYIDLFPPGSDEAMHKGSNLGNRFEGVLAETGDYRVHVYMMPNAVHRGEIADFTLDLSVDRSERSGDFADGLTGGPDFWEVTGVAKNVTLSLHSGPSVTEGVVSKVHNGTRLRNLGCKMEDGSRWCRVRTLGEDAIEGWADGRYLMESAVP
jgi:hypothetical protein